MLIAIEGIDGSGKGTQSRRLVETLKTQGWDVILFSFPRYTDTRFGAMVGEYLDGKFGVDVHPKLSAILYALDRHESLAELNAQLAVRDAIICDRFVPSNLAHQCAKLKGAEAQDLAKWLVEVEHGHFNIPVPDLVLCLDIPVEYAVQLIAKKQQRAYTDKAEDLHEADHEYLSAVRGWYSRLEGQYPAQVWKQVSVERNGHLRSIDSVFEDIFDIVESLLKSAQL